MSILLKTLLIPFLLAILPNLVMGEGIVGSPLSGTANAIQEQRQSNIYRFSMDTNRRCSDHSQVLIKLGYKWKFGGQTATIKDHIVQFCYNIAADTLPVTTSTDDSSTKTHQSGKNHQDQLIVDVFETENQLMPIDVTLVTFSTVERIRNLERLVQSWSGYITLAYYIKNNSDIETLNEAILKTPGAADRVTVHLMWARSSEPFPINLLRNIASVGVKTSHTLHFDMDFVTSKLARERILSHKDLLKSTMMGKRLMFVVPALEVPYDAGNKESVENAKKIEDRFINLELDELKSEYTKGNFKVFHDHCMKCQGATQIDRWLTANEPYEPKFKHFQDVPYEYEPYVITPTFVFTETEGKIPFILWDEVFAGYGRDKTIYFYHLRYIYGYRFMIIPNVCMMHRFHEKSTDAEKFRRLPGEIRARQRLYETRVKWWKQRVFYNQHLPHATFDTFNALNKFCTGEHLTTPRVNRIRFSPLIPSWRIVNETPKARNLISLVESECGTLEYNLILFMMSISAVGCLLCLRSMSKPSARGGLPFILATVFITIILGEWLMRCL